MTLSVKRIKNRFYVYDQRKKEGKVTMKYIGPLDRIVGLHQVVNYRGQNNVIEKVLKAFLLEVVNSYLRVNYRDLETVIDNVLNTDQREVVNFNYPMENVVIDNLISEISRVVVNWWCGGWGLNPRRPTPSGPKPDPFDLARAPPRPVLGAFCILGRV